MSTTLATVMMMEFLNAVTSMKSRVESTSQRLSQMCHSLGRVKPRSEASLRLLSAMRMMNKKGTTNTTIEARIATAPSR